MQVTTVTMASAGVNNVKTMYSTWNQDSYEVVLGAYGFTNPAGLVIGRLSDRIIEEYNDRSMRPCVLRTLPEKRPFLPSEFNTHYDEVVGLLEDIWAVEQDGIQLIKSRISPYGFRIDMLSTLMSKVEFLTFMHRGVEHNGKVISLIGFDIVGG